MRFLSVCSGIEAASVAWNPLGWEAVAFSEIEPFPCAVLAHHYPSVPNWGDMTKFQEWPDADVDLLCGGTPCQSFSVAGLRKGLADPRGNLMLTFGAIAAKYRPRWLVWENVPGVLSSNGGRDFGAFLGMLGQLGYGFAYRVLDAQFFGVAQRRRRVFVVGCLGDWRRAAAVLFERHSMSGDSAPSREAREGSAGRAARSVALRGREGGGTAELGDELQNCLRASSGGGDKPHVLIHADPIARCVTAGEAKRQDWETCNFVAHTLRGDGFDASEDGTGRGTPLVPVAFDPTQITSATNRSNPRPGDTCYTLAKGAHAPAIAFSEIAACRLSATGAGFLTGNEQMSIEQNVAGVSTPSGLKVRRLTPEECEALQGFPRGYTAIPWRGKPADQCPDGPRYKALGNSWAVPVVRWIGERINAILDGRKQPHDVEIV